MQDLRLWQ